MRSNRSSKPAPSLKTKRNPRAPSPVNGSDPDLNPPPRRRRGPMSILEIRRAALSLIQRQSGSGNDDVAKPVVEKVETKRLPKVGDDGEAELPEKYELLDRFFKSLDSSIRLLQQTRKATTFTNINKHIECLTDRRFSLSHLAQMKFIVPEAIVIEKVLQHDEHTNCMKPDLSITLNLVAIEAIGSKNKSCRHMELRNVFRNRLLDFIKSHPECDDVPEEALPELSIRSKMDENLIGSLNSTPNVATSSLPTAPASHLPPSFKRRFSAAESARASSLKNPSPENKFFSNEACLGSIVPTPHFPETPVKSVISFEEQSLLKTPVEVACTPAKVMSSRDALSTAKSSYKASEDGNSLTSPKKTLRRPSSIRPLNFDTPVKKRKVSSDNYEIFGEDLIQSIREKEREAMIEQDPEISRAKKRQKMISNLPAIFNMIHFYFHSKGRTVVSKTKLLDEMVSGNSKITDRAEVEEQLMLLQELVPEWIYEKSASSGELLVCVKTDSSAEFIRSKLAEAK